MDPVIAQVPFVDRLYLPGSVRKRVMQVSEQK